MVGGSLSRQLGVCTPNGSLERALGDDGELLQGHPEMGWSVARG
jgi:hypothetical protein